jgi:hypothetical protein
MLGLALLFAGWLLRSAGRRRAPALQAAALMPREAVRWRPEQPLSPLGGTSDYRVVVPNVGSFSTVDEAEQRELDRRWARAGSPTLGAAGQRSDESAG